VCVPLWWLCVLTARWSLPLLLLWIALTIQREIASYLARPYAYRANQVKIIELPARHFAITALALDGLATSPRQIEIVSSNARVGLLAVGVTLLSVSQLMKILMVDSRFGPYVLMIFKMLIDVGKWLVILFCVVAPSALGLSVTFSREFAATASYGRGEGDAGDAIERFEVAVERMAAIADDDSCRLMFATFVTSQLGTARILFESAFGGIEGVFGCFALAHDHGNWAFSYIILVFYVIVSVILLINLLIAVMARTFDKIYESATLNYQQQLAVVVLLASREHTVTPPFELLSLPYHAASLSVQLVRGSISLVTCHDRQQRMTRLAMAVQAVSAFARTAGDGKGGNDDDSVFTRRLVKMHKMGALAPKVEAYVEKHTGDEMQDDERHNTKLHKHLHMCLNKLDVLAGEQEKRASQLSAIDGALQELAHEHEKLRDDVTELLERAGEEEPGEGSRATNEKPNPRLSRRSKTAQPPLEATEA